MRRYGQLKPVTARLTSRTLPVSMKALSDTFNTQVPFAISPLKAESGWAGLKVPVHGASAMAMFRNEVDAESERTVWQKLFPPRESRA